ncbi:MAG: EAL domain-containing protein, partial [Halomonas sp.]
GLDIIKVVGKVSHVGRKVWLLAGASAMGVGVWSMHFIGMHAYRLEFSVTHEPVLTMLSILPAIVGSLGVMAVLSRQELIHRAVIVSGIGLGIGIGIMHYAGMAAMDMPAELYYVVDLFLVSLIVAIGLGILSVYAYRFCQQELGMQQSRSCAFVSALCVSIAICGMHYVAMQAAWFVPDPDIVEATTLPGSHGIIYIIGGVAISSALLMLIAAKVQRRLHASERHGQMTQTRLFEVIAALQDGVVLFDNKSRIRLCNSAFEQLMGRDQSQLVEVSLSQFNYAENSKELNRHIRLALERHGAWSGMINALHSSGRQFPAWLSVNRVTYTDSAASDYVALLSDRSEEQQAQQRIRYLAYHDILTELPNRQALQEKLNEYEYTKQASNKYALLTLVDIDRFKVLNDSLGQDTGDELLRQLGKRFQHRDSPELFVARLDGNEFALVKTLASTSESSAQREAHILIHGILPSLTDDYLLHGHIYPCRLNVGMLVFNPTELESTAQLFKRVSLALLEAKRLRDGVPQLFRKEQEREQEERIALERELRHAIDHDELTLHIQPQVNVERRVIGAEALVRWHHPDRGLISPGYFIPLAEETGLILPLGNWVLMEGCRLLGEWRHDPNFHSLKLSLNVSVRQFQQPDFTDQVIAAIELHAAPPEHLTLELTESLLLRDPVGVIEKMELLRRIGISFALDDFGTGYSSLSYLRLLPLDTLKIDIAFVRDLKLEMQTKPIAATIIALADSLGLEVIAEGVETNDQLQILSNLGCYVYQGFLLGRPMPVGDFQQYCLRESPYSSSTVI